MLDAFADRTATLAHILTRELFAPPRARLAEDGTLYVNLIVAPDPDRLSVATKAVVARNLLIGHPRVRMWASTIANSSRIRSASSSSKPSFVSRVGAHAAAGLEAARDAGTGGAAPDAGIMLRDALRF